MHPSNRMQVLIMVRVSGDHFLCLAYFQAMLTFRKYPHQDATLALKPNQSTTKEAGPIAYIFFNVSQLSMTAIKK